MKLTDRTVLITGGSAGIGLALARGFLRRGNTVIVTGRNEEKLKKVESENEGLTALRCDAADPEEVANLARTLAERFPKLDVLINNAGVFEFHNLTAGNHDLSRLTRELDINLAGPIRTAYALIGQLTRNRGTIVNVSSGLAFVPIQCAPIYCATKAALHSYTISLRQQLEGKVEVVELMPPAVKTEMTSELPEDGSFTLMSLEKLMEDTFRGFERGAREIRPGQSNQLHWMSRMAPGFIQGQLAKGSASLVPQPAQ